MRAVLRSMRPRAFRYLHPLAASDRADGRSLGLGLPGHLLECATHAAIHKVLAMVAVWPMPLVRRGGMREPIISPLRLRHGRARSRARVVSEGAPSLQAA